MKTLLIFLLCFNMFQLSAQLKLPSKYKGWYSGSINETIIVEAKDSLNAPIYLERSNVCLEMKSSFFSMIIGNEKIEGSFEVIEKNRKNLLVKLFANEFGTFEINLDKRKRVIFFNSSIRLPKFIVKKLKKKEKC